MIGHILASDVAHIYKISINRVYVLASLNQWGRYRDAQGRVRYRIQDVSDTMAKQDATTTPETP